MISDTIDINAGPGVGALKEFANAAEAAESKFASLQAKLREGFDAASAAPGKLAAAWDDAAARVSAAADKIVADADRASKAGASLGGIADGGKAAAAGLDAAGNSAGAAADKLKAAGDAGKGAADGLKAAGDAGKAAADGNKLAADSASASAAAFERQAAAAGAAADAQGKLRDVQGRFVAMNTQAGASAKQAAADAEASQRKYHALALGAAAFVGYGIDQAAKLQTQVIRLYTSAGVAKPDLPAIQAGILGMAGATGTDQSQLAQGAYMVGSAGFTKPDQLLGILRATAQGAYAEGAPLGETANALTSVLNAYGLKKGVPVQSQATAAMNEIMAMVGSGKMTMASAVSALPQILPAASSAGLSFGQAGGALATMTSMGMSPDQAAQNLRHTIGSLQNPNSVQTAEMYMLGLDPVSIAKNLPKAGLTGTMAEIQAAVQKNTDKRTGLVDLSPMNMSKAATQDSLLMLKQMPPAIRDVAKAYLDGGITQKDWMTDVKAMTPLQANLAKQFATVADVAHGYNAALKAGQPASQAAQAAISKLMGGTVGLNTYLSLTGTHLSSFQHNTEAVSAAARDAGQNIKGWGDITRTAGFQLKSFEYSAKAAATTVGAALLPEATGLMTGLAHVGSFLASNPDLTKALGIGGGILGASYAISKVASPVMTGIQGIGKVAQVLQIPGLDKLANFGKNSGAATMATAADTNAKAAGGMADAADVNLRAAGLMAEAATGNKEGAAAGDLGALGALGAKGKAAGGLTAAEETAGAFSAASIAKSLIPGLLRSGIVLAIGDMIARGLTSAAPKATPQAMKRAGVDPSHPGFLQQVDEKIYGKGVDNLIADINQNFSAPARNAIKDVARDALYEPFLSGPHRSGAFTSGAGSRFGYPANIESQIGQEDTASAPRPAPVVTAAQDYRTMAGFRGTATAAVPVKAKVDVDLSTLNEAKTKAQTALAGISSTKVQPVKIPQPDISGITTAKTRAISELQSMRGPATAAGANAGAGLASGITSETGAVVAAASAVASAAATAMNVALQTRSPSKVTEKTGQGAGDGVAVGLHKSVPKVKAASMSIAAATVTSLEQGLQGGQSAVDAALSAILGKDNRPQDIAQIDSTVQTLMGDLSAAMSKKIISKGEDSALVSFLKKDQKQLDGLAAKRSVLITEISNAQQTATSIVSGASIMNAANAQPAGATPAQSSYSLVQGMQYQAQQAKQFAADLGKLKKAGVNATTLDQISQAGADQGDSVAQGILSGGKGAVTQLNQLQSQITASAGQIGNVAGPAAYQSGQDISAQTAKGLKSQLSSIDSQMKQVATSMTNAVKAAVGGAGTQAAMKAAGVNDARSYVGGIASQIPSAAAAAQQLAQAAASGVSGGSHGKSPAKAHPDMLGGPVERPQHQMVPQPRYGGGSGGGGAPQVHVTVYLTATMDGHQVAAAISEQSVVTSTNNWQSGTHSPYRPA